MHARVPGSKQTNPPYFAFSRTFYNEDVDNVDRTTSAELQTGKNIWGLCDLQTLWTSTTILRTAKVDLKMSGVDWQSHQ